MADDTRRTFLKTVGLAVGATGIAGATETKFGVLADDDTPSTLPLDGKNWSTFQYDLANTGHSPSSAPSEYPFVEWSMKVGETGYALSPPTIVDGTGYTVNTNGTLTAFDLETQKIDWQVALAGDGEKGTYNLSPTVAGDVVLASAHGVLHARNISGGSVKWTTFDGADTGYDWTLSPTTVVDGTVYVTVQDDGLYALDLADGSERWSMDAPANRYAPAVADGMVYFTSQKTIHALDAENGTKQWQKTHEYQPTTALTVADGRVYADNREYVLALDATDGTQLWSQGGYYNFGGSSAYADGKLFCVTESGKTFALDGATGTELWRSTEIGQMTSSLSVANGVVYIISDGVFSARDEKGAFGLDAKTGDVLWRYEPRDLSYYTDPSSPSPTIADGTLYVGDDMGYVYALGPTAPKGVNWRFKIAADMSGDWVNSAHVSPAVGDGTVYNRDGYDLVAIDEESGTERWRFEGDSEPLLAPTFANGTVFVDSGPVYALDGQTGAVQWKRSFDDRCEAVTATDDGTVYVSTYEQLFALDADTGKQEWVAPGDQCSALRSPRTDLVVTDDDIFYAAANHLYSIDRTDGRVRWSVYNKDMETGSVHAGLTVEDGTVYVGVNDTHSDGPNNVLAFDAEDGSKQWGTQVTDMPVEGIAAHGDSLYVTFENGGTPLLIELSADDGTVRWRFEGNDDGGKDGIISAPVTAPVVMDDTVYFAGNRRIHAFDSDGNRTGRWEASGPIVETPVLGDDAVYVPSADQLHSGLRKYLYSFDRDE